MIKQNSLGVVDSHAHELYQNTVNLNYARGDMPFANRFFGILKIQVRLLINEKSKGCLVSSLSTYDFCTLYTTLPHDPITVKL